MDANGKGRNASTLDTRVPYGASKDTPFCSARLALNLHFIPVLGSVRARCSVCGSRRVYPHPCGCLAGSLGRRSTARVPDGCMCEVDYSIPTTSPRLRMSERLSSSYPSPAVRSPRRWDYASYSTCLTKRRFKEHCGGR